MSTELEYDIDIKEMRPTRKSHNNGNMAIDVHHPVLKQYLESKVKKINQRSFRLRSRSRSQDRRNKK